MEGAPGDQRSPVSLGERESTQLAAALVLDRAASTRCVVGEAADAITADLDEGRRLGVNSTPTFFVDNVQADGSIQLMKRMSRRDAVEYFQKMVDAAVVTGEFLGAWPLSRDKLSVDLLLGLFILGVLANVAYCAAYFVDLFVQFSGLHAEWRRGRLTVLIVGTAFAATLTHFYARGFFEP